MAGSHPFLTKLRGVVKTLDDEALASLANKGLVRRAQKDLEAARPTIVGVEEERVRLQVAEATVEVPDLPARSTCSCPATGICRHILTALIYLRDDPELAAADAPVQGALFASDGSEATVSPIEMPPAAPSPEVVLANLTDEDLQKWAGKALFKRAQKALAANPQVEIESAAALVVRFPTRNITCRWIPSGGLLGMVCSCQAETVCEHVVAAVLAYQASLGRRKFVSDQAVLEESAGAPRTRAEVLASVGTVLRELISLGLSRLSAATAQRLTTLAISAHGVDLPRLERMLKTLADEVQLALRRDAQASSSNLLALAARTEALCSALSRNAMPQLVGQHRSQYHDVGQITLIGLGAQHWRSKSGFHGLTVYFWDESRKGWATWSESRPVNQQGFDPAGRFRADGPWPGCSSPQEASRSTLRLSGAWRNPDGRLSGRAATRALVTGPSKPAEFLESGGVAIKDWSQLAARARRLFGGALSDRTENVELVLLAPKIWGPPLYDSLRQELLRPVVDEKGRAINLWLPFSPEKQAAVEMLEQHDAGQTRGLLGALRLIGGRICVEPISLYTADKTVHLNLDKPAASSSASATPKGVGAESEEEESLGEGENGVLQAAGVTPLSRLLISVEAELEGMADAGIAVRRKLDILGGAARRLEVLGLSCCARPLQRLLDALASSAKLAERQPRSDAAAALLHAYYVFRLASDQETIAAACEGLG